MSTQSTAGAARKYHYAILKSNAPQDSMLVPPNGVNIEESEAFFNKDDPRRQVVFFALKVPALYDHVKNMVPNGIVSQCKGPMSTDDARVFGYLVGSYREKRDWDRHLGVPLARDMFSFKNPGPFVTRFEIDEHGQQYVAMPRGSTEAEGEPDTKRNREE